jgi:hypothetical protein
VRSHWYRGKMLGRVGGRNFMEREPALRRPLYEEVRRLALERYGDEVDAYMAFNARVRSRLLRDDRYDALVALAGFEAGLRTEATVVELAPDDEGVSMAIEARIVDDDGPLAFVRDGERLRWSPPGALVESLPPETLDVGDDLEGSYADVLVWSIRDGTEFSLRTETETRLEPVDGADGLLTPVLTAQARLTPRVAVAKAKLSAGEWTVGVTAAAAGFLPPGVPAQHGRRPLRAPLALTVTRDGRVMPPRLRREVARRFPAVARVFKRPRAASAG